MGYNHIMCTLIEYCYKDLQRPWDCWTVQTYFLTDLLDCDHTFSWDEQRDKALINIFTHKRTFSQICKQMHKRTKAYTHDMTVLVDTMYSSSLVQGFTKLNH